MSVQRFTSLRPQADLPQLIAVLGARRPSNGLSPQGSWYSIKNLSDSTAEICIYDEIGFYGISDADFIRDLNAIKASNINLRVSSGGGDVFQGLNMFTAIKRHPANITAIIDSIAASAASFICMAANTVVMSPHSVMMIHEAAGGLVIGNADDMRQMADLLDKTSMNIASIYAERAGGTVEEWRARMKEETWLSDQEAVDLGLADMIDGREPKAKVSGMAIPADERVRDEEPPVPTIDFRKLINEQAEAAEAVFA